MSKSKVFSVDILIAATAYIRADSATEAAEIVARMDTGFEFYEGQLIAEDISISGVEIDSDELPDFSFSPAATAYPVKISTDLRKAPALTADDFELANGPDEAAEEGENNG